MGKENVSCSFTSRYVKHIFKWFSKNTEVIINANKKGNFWKALHEHTKDKK